MTFGLSNGPTTFQKLISQVPQRMKQDQTVQDLLKHGAVIEFDIDEVPRCRHS